GRERQLARLDLHASRQRGGERAGRQERESAPLVHPEVGEAQAHVHALATPVEEEERAGLLAAGLDLEVVLRRNGLRQHLGRGTRGSRRERQRAEQSCGGNEGGSRTRWRGGALHDPPPSSAAAFLALSASRLRRG